MKRLLILIYSVVSYLLFLIGIGFLFLLLTNIGIHNMMSNDSISGIMPWWRIQVRSATLSRLS
ncbi:hypothetical protein [Providencia vermicola]|uniref:hypothetical protein n=1 Tax=Providencia vermicola TaxID=333965 RepID=UPI0034E3CCE8